MYIRSGNITEATYWKKNISVDIGSILNGITTATAVSGNDVYTAGFYSTDINYLSSNPYYGDKAIYRESNLPVKLSNATTCLALRIAVVQQ